MKSPRLVCRLVALVVIGVCVLGVPALAQDCPELVGQLGPVSAVAVSGNYAYFGGGALMIADIADPAAPQVVGEAALTKLVQGVAVSSGYAYVAATTAGLRVIDVSDPSEPVEVGHVDTPGVADDVAVEGSYAYVAWGSTTLNVGGLLVIDVSTPSAPVEVGSLDAPGAAHDIAVSGSYAYVMSPQRMGGFLTVIDVSTPSAPEEVVSIGTLDGDVAVSGDYAYVSGCAGDVVLTCGLGVFDVSDSSAPVGMGSITAVDAITGDVAVSGGYAYVIYDPYGFVGSSLRVIDVSTPSAPAVVGSVTTPDVALGVAVAGGHAYVAASGAGLRVVDVQTPSAPVEVGSCVTLGRAADVAVSGGFAYVAGGDLHVLDVSVPSRPVEVGLLGMQEGGTAWNVALSGGYAYVVTTEPFEGHVAFLVIDVSTPSVPVVVGYLYPPLSSHGHGDLALSGRYAYVTAGQGLHVIDVGTASAPVEVGYVDTASMTGTAPSVSVERGYAYVADRDAGLRVIDVSTPSAPVEVGFYDTPGEALGVAVSGDYAFVTDTGATLRVIDVSTPSAPVEVGVVATDGWGTAVALAGDLAYVMYHRLWDDSGFVESSLRVIDVSTPSAPVEVGFHEMPRTSIDDWSNGSLAISDGYVFPAAWDAGLYVFSECTGPLPDAPECFIPAAAYAAGAQGAFFQTDLEINNTGAEEAQLTFQWLPRGEDNSEPVSSDPITVAAGQSLRYENVLTELFGLQPDSLGALKMVASTESVIGMSRTYNIPAGKIAGTFGQGLPAIRATEMIQGTEPQRIIFLSENDDSRANVGCVNGSTEPVTINIGLFNSEGESLETKTMDLGPWSNDQINRIFEDYAPVNGYVDVWADSDEALYYCYGSMLDNDTSDPTTILPQMPSDDTTFIPAAALAAGLQGSFFETDVDLNNVGSTDITYELLWLPRGADNSDPVHSDLFSLAPGAGVRYANVLDEVFGLEPDQVGALALEASGMDLLAMSRTYNLPLAKVAGTFGQELPGIPADRMIPTGEKKRIIFMSENDDVRANVGCVNGVGIDVAVQIELYNSDGVKLETKYMMLPPYSSRQINGIFQDYAPINGYVDVRTYTPEAAIYCYGSVLDNSTSDPTTVLPQ